LLEWRNDPGIRYLQLTKDEIAFGKHQIWFESRLKNLENQPFYAFVLNGDTVGFARLDLKVDSKFYISILVAPEQRGMGVGNHILKEFLSAIRNKFLGITVYARIHNQNIPSISIFRKNCFSEILPRHEKFLLFSLKIT
jgi:RimJ/RimL family protein N-acetyltransferase